MLLFLDNLKDIPGAGTAVKKANYISDYKIQLDFNNGKSGIADLEQTLQKDTRALFAELKNTTIFKNFNLQHDTVIWPNGLDLAPEYLFYLAFINEDQLQDQFQSWGYI